MNVIALVSLKGGTGRTALAAHLGSVLAARQRVLLVDADPQNGLGLYFGLDPAERFGLVRKGLGSADLLDMIRRDRPEVPYLPFGTTTSEERRALEEEIAPEPAWLQHRIEAFAGSEYDTAIIDTPPGDTLWARQALVAATQVIVVMHADPIGYATLPAMEEWLMENPNPRYGQRGEYFLINAYDPREAVGADTRDALMNLLPDRVLPIAVPRDTAMREAAAHQRTLATRAPDSEVLRALSAISEELEAAHDRDLTPLGESRVVPIR